LESYELQGLAHDGTNPRFRVELVVRLDKDEIRMLELLTRAYVNERSRSKGGIISSDAWRRLLGIEKDEREGK